MPLYSLRTAKGASGYLANSNGRPQYSTAQFPQLILTWVRPLKRLLQFVHFGMGQVDLIDVCTPGVHGQVQLQKF
jgi:hypothetical protein